MIDDNQKTEWQKFCDDVEKFKAEEERKMKKWPFTINGADIILFVSTLFLAYAGQELVAIFLVLWRICFAVLNISRGK